MLPRSPSKPLGIDGCVLGVPGNAPARAQVQDLFQQVPQPVAHPVVWTCQMVAWGLDGASLKGKTYSEPWCFTR